MMKNGSDPKWRERSEGKVRDPAEEKKKKVVNRAQRAKRGSELWDWQQPPSPDKMVRELFRVKNRSNLFDLVAWMILRYHHL
jgi:hypothetical protein